MGFLDIFKKKNSFNKLTREQVVESIVELERQEQQLEAELDAKDAEIAALKEKGRTETNQQRRILYAKKIQYLTKESSAIVQRIMFNMYNTSLLERLKVAVDDKNFFMNSQNQSLNAMLGDQRALAEFLNGALQTRVKAEDMFTSADETFNMIQSEYTPKEEIYGLDETEDDILASFECQQEADTFADATMAPAAAATTKNADVL
jgi:hypothetical protein